MEKPSVLSIIDACASMIHHDAQSKSFCILFNKGVLTFQSMQTSTFDVNLHQSELNEKCKSVKAPNHVDVIIDFFDFANVKEMMLRNRKLMTMRFPLLHLSQFPQLMLSL